MSRPAPNILMEFVDGKTYKSEQVLDAEAIWAVFYKDKPFNLKSQNKLTNYPGPKYKKNWSPKDPTAPCARFQRGFIFGIPRRILL